VPINSLRALAELPGSQSVYVPVILGKASGVYEIVFYTASQTRFPSFQILDSKQKVIDSQSRRNFSDIDSEVKFNWDGRKNPAGRYKLRYVAEM
jgi:flagellar basal-body rod modification protein FlgD